MSCKFGIFWHPASSVMPLCPMLFHTYCTKNVKKEGKSRKLRQTYFFGLRPRVLFQEKTFFQSFCFWKCLFLGKKTSTSVWVQTQTSIFFAQLNDFSSFHIFGAKNLNLLIMSSIWSVQHPNAGWNIQQLLVCFVKSALLLKVKMEASGRIKEGF